MISVSVEGVARAITKFAELEAATQAAAVAGEKATASSVLERARAKAPVDTGRLRESITTKEEDGDVLVGTVGVPYAPFVEFGTANAAAQPFLRPAADGASEEFPKEVAVALNAAIRAVVGL